MDLSGLAAVTTAAEMKAWLSANCLSPISPVMTGTDLGIIIQKIIDVTGEVPSFAFENGLTNNNGTVALGGTLTGDVVYNQGNYLTKFNFTDNALNDSFVALGEGYVEIQTNGLTYNNSSARNVGVGTDISISDGLMDFQVYNLTGSTYSGEFTLGVYGFANRPASAAWSLSVSSASGTKEFSSVLNVPFGQTSTAINKGMIFMDSWDNVGLQYYNDYSAVGKTSPRWIPDWGAVTAAISASVGSATPAWSSITGKPTTLSGYGITDAYPLTGNPSGFLTGITSGQVAAALGFTPYSASNPASYISLGSLSNAAPITYNAATGAIGITQATTSTNGYLSSTDWNTFNGKQAALSGTGFVKISGATISYDNSTYLTTSTAASTYAPKASPAFTGTVTLPSTVVNGSIIPNVNNTYNLGSGGSIFNVLWVYGVNVGNAITLDGSTSGSINLFAPAAPTPYNFILPSTGGTAGYVLTSSGGGSSPMTWTSLSGYLTSATAASTYVPYTGATGTVNLGGNTLFAGTLGVGATSAISPYKFFVSNNGNNGFEINPAAAGGIQTDILSYNRSTSAYTPLTLNASSFTFSSGALFGNTTGTPTATPLIVNLGGTFGTNTPGSYANQKLRLYDDGTGPHSYGLGVSSVGLLEIQAGTSAGIGFFVNGGTQAMNISTGGNVGIGTSNPAFKLDVQGGSASIYNNGAATGLTLGSNATGKTSIAIATSADASGYGYIQSISSFGTAFGNIAINPSGGNVGIGTASPQANLHIQGLGVSTNANSEYSYYGAIIQANTGSRSATIGAELEFVIPANTDGSNPWGQGRIITVAGNGNNGDATGKMILGTRRMFDKLGAGASWYYGDDITIDGHGYVGIGVTNPLAKFDIAAGTSAVASLRMGAGSLLTTPVSGAIEYDGTNLYYTNSTPKRQTLAILDSPVFTGIVSMPHLKGSSGTPTISASTGAGTGATVSIQGNDTAGLIHVISGTSAAANSVIASINFANSYGANVPYVIVAPYGSTQFAGSTGVCATSASSNGFLITSGNTALGSAISYYFTYHVIG